MSIPIKTAEEIESMRVSCRAAREILEEVSLAVVPGVSTGEIDKLAARLINGRGGRSPFLGLRGFPGHICISVNDEIVHGIGGARRIQYGDIVKLDIGILLNGWIGDTATTIAVGDIPAATARLLEKTQEALAVGIEQARPGNRVHHISEAIEKFVVANGYSVVREFVGHGVGRALHEEPHVPNYGHEVKARLRPGMALAIEPMVNLGRAQVRQLADGWTVVTADGKPSAHFEHTVLITEDEPEILTCLPETASKSKAR
ncbi:MAG TPA: type I methionyl aminopeptidase [Candidatus Methylacidiphilales bacterium]|nr:type I methionyl aminopeptidase [Candidatus Methylacidiphilales bacterium]